MKLTRRWFQFSLRSFLVLMTAFAVWLGVVVSRAREQREAVKAIEALGGDVQYDWQSNFDPFGPDPGQPPGPVWLRRLIGDDFFQKVEHVLFSNMVAESDIINAIPDLQRLQGLKYVAVFSDASNRTQVQLKAALPGCTFVF